MPASPGAAIDVAFTADLAGLQTAARNVLWENSGHAVRQNCRRSIVQNQGVLFVGEKGYNHAKLSAFFSGGSCCLDAHDIMGGNGKELHARCDVDNAIRKCKSGFVRALL